ncbi:MAG: hypothetical protein L0Z62_04050 [Gemmataceae bacterium]|nr:hypothetical protein [Gemmataceae bacterium]
MAEPRHRLTPALGQRICAFIRAGGYPEVAAEAVGVPRRVFERWMARGLRQGAREPYRSFAESVRQAEAEARIRAEIAAYKKDALNWLKGGPGREGTGRPGWSMPVKAADGKGRRVNPLLLPEVARLLAALLQALAPFPEARAAAAAVLEREGDGPPATAPPGPEPAAPPDKCPAGA